MVRPTVTFPVVGHHRPLTGTKLLVTEPHVYEQLARGCYLKAQTPAAGDLLSRPNEYTTRPHIVGPNRRTRNLQTLLMLRTIGGPLMVYTDTRTHLSAVLPAIICCYTCK